MQVFLEFLLVFTVFILPHLVYDTIWLLRGWAKSHPQDLPQIETMG